MKSKRKNNRFKIKLVIAIAALAIFVVAMCITDIFIPVRYITAYMTVKDTPVAGELRVSFLDVGYGDCTIVELPDGKSMVIDGGDGTYSHELKLLTALNKSRIDTVDYLVCTTARDEHCGGLYELLKFKSVKTVYAPYIVERENYEKFNSFYELAKECAERVEYCEYGVEVSANGYAFAFLSPDSHTSPIFYENSSKNLSSILYLEYAGQKLLFLSDSTTKEQKAVLDAVLMDEEVLSIGGKNRNLNDISVIKASNHGGKSSFSELLYDLTTPEAAIISVGSNGYGAPNADTVQNISNNCKIYRTDYDGSICVRINEGGELTLSKEKK